MDEYIDPLTFKIKSELNVVDPIETDFEIAKLLLIIPPFLYVIYSFLASCIDKYVFANLIPFSNKLVEFIEPFIFIL